MRVLVISGFYLCFLVNNSLIALKQCKFENCDWIKFAFIKLHFLYCNLLLAIVTKFLRYLFIHWSCLQNASSFYYANLMQDVHRLGRVTICARSKSIKVACNRRWLCASVDSDRLLTILVNLKKGFQFWQLKVKVIRCCKIYEHSELTILRPDLRRLKSISTI